MDPKTLRITPLGEGDPTQLRQVVHNLVQNAPVTVGVNHYVMAHLRGAAATGDLSQRTTAFLTPPLDSEAEAQQLCDGIAQAWFMVLSTNPATGGAHWPEPAPATAERFGLR